MSGTSGMYLPPQQLIWGQAVLPPPGVFVMSLPVGEWTDLPLFVDLPEPGVYWFGGSVVISFQGPASSWTCYRLFDETAGVVVADSARRVGAGSTEGGTDFISTSPVSVYHTAAAATRVRLQAMRNAAGVAGGILSTVTDGDQLSMTMLTFERKGDI